MFNDIQKHIEKKKEQEAEAKHEESIKRIDETTLAIMELLRTKDLTINEALISIEACSRAVKGFMGAVPLKDVVKE